MNLPLAETNTLNRIIFTRQQLRQPYIAFVSSNSNNNNNYTCNTRVMNRLTALLLQIIFVAFTVILLVFYADPFKELNVAKFINIISNSNGRLCSKHDGQLYKIHSLNAKCMDGTPPGYYYRPSYILNGDEQSTNKSTQWHIHFEGGGWCYDLESCFTRSSTRLGSSKSYPLCNRHEFKDYLSNEAKLNPLMYSWNHVLVKYCDSASYAGDSVQQYHGHTMYFHGKHNRDETILDLLLTHGMDQASEILISGCSAGGLGLYLGVDQMAGIIQQYNPTAKVTSLADSGYFPDYSGSLDWMSEHEYPEAIINGAMDYSTAMKNVFSFANVSSGAHPDCITANPSQEELCIFAENLAPHIKTPMFALQPQYDHWQIWHIVGKPFEYSLINEYGSNLTTSLINRLLSNPAHGAFIDSCVHHCTKCSSQDLMWIGLQVDSIAEEIAFTRWYTSDFTDRDSGYLIFANHTFPCEDCCNCSI